MCFRLAPTSLFCTCVLSVERFRFTRVMRNDFGMSIRRAPGPRGVWDSKHEHWLYVSFVIRKTLSCCPWKAPRRELCTDDVRRAQCFWHKTPVFRNSSRVNWCQCTQPILVEYIWTSVEFYCFFILSNSDKFFRVLPNSIKYACTQSSLDISGHRSYAIPSTS